VHSQTVACAMNINVANVKAFLQYPSFNSGTIVTARRTRSADNNDFAAIGKLAIIIAFGTKLLMTIYENGYILLCNHSLLGFFLIALHDLDEHQFLDPCKTIGNSTYRVTTSFNRVP